MSKIKILDSHLTNMIAAGEVVERPAGIIKELVENSLDANANRIEIRFEEGGMDYIEVSDNGEGMSFDDLKNAFNRHSTSKIKEETDLNQIHTFGFRGEALPSIASVSHVEVISNNSKESSKIVINNGKEIEHTAFARNTGTTVKVRNLFSQLPARLKHIKNLHYEAAIILDIVQKFALGNPDVSFTLYNGEKLTFQSMGDGNLNDVYYRVYGSAVSKDSYYFKDENYDFSIEGVYTLPNHNRANRYAIWLYVNKRMIRYPKLQNAVIDAYRRHLAPNRFPIIMMNINTDPQLVDVNVHPSKWEIRMSQEPQLIELVQNHIENLLHKDTKAPEVKISEPEQINIKEDLLRSRDFTETFHINEFKENELLRRKETFTSSHHDLDYESIQEKTRENLQRQSPFESEEAWKVEEEHSQKSQIEPLNVLSQMSGKYILAQGDEGLYIIDQHAAMERVRYEYYQNKLLNQESPMQAMLIPLVFEGRQSLIPMIESINKDFYQFQIQLEVFSEDSLIVRELPGWLKHDDAKDFIDEVLDLIESNKVIREEDLRRDALASLACHSSVRFNEYLSMHEMEKLVEDLRACTQPFHCPHGRPTLIAITHKQLIKEFKR